MATACIFEFAANIDAESLESHVALAIVAAECVLGQAKVRINAAYSVVPTGPTEDHRGPRVAIDVSSDVGEFVAQVFAGLAIRQFGEDGFAVDRVAGCGQELLRGVAKS